MNAPPAPHPTDQTLQAYGLGRLDAHALESVRGHLTACATCRRRVAELSTVGPPGPDRPESPPPVGSIMGGISTVEGGSGTTAPPPVDSLPPGLADHPNYRVLRELGRGGMGVVYLAENTLMGRKEVLKVVSRELMSRRTVAERFLREIHNAAQLQHPNIVTAYTAIRAGEQIVLAMEYVEGYDLARLVATQGPLPVAHACNFIYQAALGLEHARERGMVHRDIKPSNLMLARQGARPVVKILDFGLAKATQEGPIDAGLTREGQMLGTPDYIAPEQSLNAQKADIRADIYSLGCTFYCLLAGRPPFTANSLFELLQAHHSRDAAPLNLVRPDVPATLAALVARMMAKDPASRFQTPGEVAQAIKPFLKPGEAKAEATQAARTVASPVTPAKPPQTVIETAPTAGNMAQAAQPATAWDAIDRGQEAGLSRPESGLYQRGASAMPWLWPSVAAGAVVFGLALVWTFGLAPKSKDGPGEPSAPVVASRPDPGTAGAPGNVAPPVRSDTTPTPPIAPVKQPEPVSVAQVATAQKTPTPPVVPEPPIRKPSSPITKIVTKDRPVEAKTKAVAEPILDFRYLPIHPVVGRLVNAGNEPPPGGIWPTLTADNTRSWQFGVPDLIEINRQALALSAGPNGNLLLTRRDDYTSGTLTITMAATKGTEAFLALRAHPGPDGWQAITLRVKEEGGKVWVDHPSLDFQPPKDGAKPLGFAPGQSFLIRFEIHGDNVARVAIKQEKWALACKNPPASEYKGSIGLFVKSGTIRLSKLNVPE